MVIYHQIILWRYNYSSNILSNLLLPQCVHFMAVFKINTCNSDSYSDTMHDKYTADYLKTEEYFLIFKIIKINQNYYKTE